MRESSLVPTNLKNWPRVENLSFEEKMIFNSIWSDPCLNACGFGEFGVKTFAAGWSTNPDLVMNVIRKLVKIELLEFNQETRELFILDWFRFHNFGGKQQVFLKSQRENPKIRCEKIKNLFLEKSQNAIKLAASKPPQPKPPSSRDDEEF